MLEQALRVVVDHWHADLIVLVAEELEPADILALRIHWRPVVLALTSHVVVGMVTGDGHQGVQEDLAAGDVLCLHTGHHVLLVVVGHVDGADEVVGAVLLQCLLQLGVAHVGLEGVVGVGVAMAHEGDDTLPGLGAIQCVQLLSHLRDVLVGVAEQGHAEEHGLVLLQLCQILVVEVGAGNVAVVHEFLHAGHDGRELLARDDLQRLHVDLAVLGGTDGMQQIAGLIVVALHNLAVVVGVLTGTGAVDADVA